MENVRAAVKEEARYLRTNFNFDAGYVDQRVRSSYKWMVKWSKAPFEDWMQYFINTQRTIHTTSPAFAHVRLLQLEGIAELRKARH